MENFQNDSGSEGNSHTGAKTMEDGCKRRKLYSDADETIYYGVHIPSASECQPFEDIEKTNVFGDKTEALKLVKKYKKARFKAFNYYHEAIEFAMHGSECAPRRDAEPAAAAGEKCQFRGPKTQDMIRLRKAIEADDLRYVERAVWENPRYLVSSGDTPSILVEGYRYNGLHVAAKARNARMCELILNTVGNTDFIGKLYGDDAHQDPEGRARVLLDLYLNTPDKGMNETPLHFAVKFGAAECVEVLVSFPQCDKNIRNRYGELPNQIVCDRCDASTAEKLKEHIAAVLEDSYYVPVLRSEDNCTPPIIGPPFSPTSPPDLCSDPLSPRLEIHAYAGPMDRKGADRFRRMWKMPPRSLSRGRLRLSTSLDSAPSGDVKLCDPEKGLEAVGRELATRYNVSWREYWPFLDDFTDIGSEEGLRHLEGYLRDQNERSSLGVGSPEAARKPSAESASSIDSLCRRFDELCTLEDDEDEGDSIMGMAENREGVCPFVCLEHSSKIFANRICNILKNFVRSDDTGEFNGNSLLMTEMKLFEQLIVSYGDDERFSEIDFQRAHPRLANLVVSHLRCKENNILSLAGAEERLREICTKSLDFFITSNVISPTNKQLTCVLKSVLRFIDEEAEDVDTEDCQITWKNAERCSCTFKQSREKCNARRKNGGGNHLTKRNNGVKFRGGTIRNGISKNLFRTDGAVGQSGFRSPGNDGDTLSSGDDDEFYTPPSSPPSFCNDDIDDQESFDDSCLPDAEVFIEGSEPNKIDRDVYNALRQASDKLNPADYPNIYKWRHAVGSYTDEERTSWSSPKADQLPSDFSARLTSTPCRGNAAPNRDDGFASPPIPASPRSWFRITGLNSPRASLNTYKSSLSFNL